MIPRCELCGTCHHAYQGHVFASNRSASNNVVVKADRPAINSVVKDAEDKADVPASAVRVDAHAKQRWSREAYNAYQREYMRKRRAK